MDAPEKIISQAHGQARPVTDFLHENVLDFINDDAMDDVWLVSSYLSDVDYLLANSILTSPRMITGTYESENVTQAIAASVAVRGVLFGNSHPSPSRWRSIRSPRLWQIEQSSRRNKNQILKERFGRCGTPNLRNMSHVAMEYRPIMKWLKSQTPESANSFAAQCPYSILDDDSEQVIADEYERNNSSEESEVDDIEDW